MVRSKSRRNFVELPERHGYSIENVIDSRRLISSYRSRFGFSKFYETTSVEDKTDLDSIKEADESADSSPQDVQESRIEETGRPSNPEYAEKLRNNPTVQLAVKSFRTMRRSALTPVARRLRDVMVQRYPVYPPAVNLDALNNTDWTEVAINVPRLPSGFNVANSSKGMVNPAKLIRNTFGADILIMVGTLLAFAGSAVTLFASYGNFSSPETRPLILGLGPPLIGVGFLFCLLRLFFCRSRSINCSCCRSSSNEDPKAQGSGKLMPGVGKKVHPILEQIQNGNGIHMNGSMKNGGPETSSSNVPERKFSGPVWTIT